MSEIFIGVNQRTFTGASALDHNAGAKARSADWRNRLGLNPPTSGDKVAPERGNIRDVSDRNRIESRTKRISEKPGYDGAYKSGADRVSHGEPPVRPTKPLLSDDDEMGMMSAKKQIYKNLGLAVEDEDDEDDDEDEETAVARRKAGKTARMTRQLMAREAVRNPGGTADMVLRNLAMGQPWRGPCPD